MTNRIGPGTADRVYDQLDESGNSAAQMLLVLGAMGYQRTRDLPLGVASLALHQFDGLIATAKRQGFKSRKQLISAVRRGSGTDFAISKAAEAVAVLSDEEIGDACVFVAGHARLMHGTVELQRRIRREAEVEALRNLSEHLATLADEGGAR